MEVLDRSFKKQMTEYERILSDISDKDYDRLYQKFLKYYKNGKFEYEQIFVYFLYVYYLGAVYDEREYDKVVFAVSNTIIIREFDFAIWLKNNRLDFDMQVDFVHKFAREIEHSDLNLKYYEGLIKYNKEYKLNNILLGLF